MGADKNPKKPGAGHAARKAYRHPRLVDFGPIGALTQAGTGNAAEGKGKKAGNPARKQ